ncbi:ribosome hibernation-promoting factor, HPF/YfiA family [Segetibacter koreensis]|uniref:ribosome hibernation-promoting factor, HPF/YfiA family n=1 Tax=Segetibacter koreensis TaxID=398037 RepID=UPI0003682458|nr:ribosome-associated translation inhibitor RaiA [Segetibacter koreensis]
MILHIETPHFESDTSLEELIRSKFEHLDKLYQRIENIDVVLRKVNDDHDRNCEIEAKLLVPKKTLFATEREETFEEALRKVINDVEHQLRKHKEELNEKR